MNSLEQKIVNIKSNAKINIGLNVLEKLPSGYHSLDMTMIPISLSDEIEIEFFGTPGDLVIETNKKNIPTDKSNILWKIYESFYVYIDNNKKNNTQDSIKVQNQNNLKDQNKFDNIDRQKINVYLEKNIPSEAGLGGGSSNGAFFLVALNSYYGNVLSQEELMEIGKGVGADIPFFIKNVPARVCGIGEKIFEIENNLDADVVLIKPQFGVSTRVAYEGFLDLKKSGSLRYADITKIINGLKSSNLKDIEYNCFNTLEESLLMGDENIRQFRKYLDENFDKKFFMSGSGSCYYTFCKKDETKEYVEFLKNQLTNCNIYGCSFL